MAEVRATPLPQLQGTQRPVIDAAAARSTNYSAAPPAVGGGASLDGLMRGLSVFNQNLGQYTESAITAEQDRLHKVVSNQAAADAARAPDAPETLDMASSQDLPANVPLAYGDQYREALGSLLVDRAAIKAKAEWATAYAEESKKPDFNPEQFIQEFRGKTLGGIQNPALVGRMGQQLSTMEGALRSEAEKKRIAALEAEVNSGMFSSFEENIRGDMSPQEIANTFMQMRPAMEPLGKSKKELNAMLLTRLASLSVAKGGDPSVFDVFSQVDPITKQSIMSMHPELADNVQAAKDKATAMQSKALEQATQGDNLKSLAGLNQMLDMEPEKITLGLVTDYMGEHNVFANYQSAAAFLHQAQQKVAAKLPDLQAAQAFNDGTLGRFPPDIQKKVLEAQLGPAITQMWQAAAGGDANQSEALARLILQKQSASRSTENVGALERLITSTVTNAPNPQGPDASFKVAADLYRRLSADPQYRDSYFKDDAATLVQSYNRAVGNGSDPNAAYAAAYQSISPQAKEAAAKFTKTPEFTEKLKKATKDVVGSSFWPRWLGGNGRIGNQVQVEVGAAAAVKDFLSASPYASQDEVNDYVGSWVAKNYVMDPQSNSAIKVPPGLADDTTKEALAAFSKHAMEVMSGGGDWKVQYRPLGDQGLMQVVMADGAAEKQVATVSIQEIRKAYTDEKVITEADRKVFAALQVQVTAGQLDPAFVEANRPLIAKARMLKALPPETLKNIEKYQLETVQKNLQAVPKMSLGQPTLEGLQFVPTRGAKVDNKLTADIALRAATSPGYGAPHQGLAASLVTMGEAVVLKASPDPNPAAGMNIGMGYNLKANVKNYKSDFVRAGIPADKVEAVFNGEAQITPQQAERLLMVSMPRYEKTAFDTAEKTAPGLWNRMTSGQRAVMVDIAWQTGDPAQFKKAWASLAAGNVEAFKNETKVMYTNKAGERVEDKRRNDLRAAMLNGEAQWTSVVRKYGGFPSNAVEAFALNKPQ